MPALNFNARFADAVKQLEKRQTIRARGKRNPPRVGDVLFLYTGMRTASCRKLATVACANVTPITIDTHNRTVTMPNPDMNAWWELNEREVEEIVHDDGFSGTDEFFSWFREQYGKTMSGYLIQW